MKNMKKFAAGFIAAAMAMSMSLSAFAEVVTPFEAVTAQNDDMYNKSTQKLVININDENQDQLTMMAYLVPSTTKFDAEAADKGIPAYVDQTIIALDQNAGANGFTEVPIDPEKLGENSIVVKIGGSAGEVATYLISLAEEVITYTVTYDLDEGTVDGTNEETFGAEVKIVDFFAKVTAPTKDGYNFTGWTDENGTAVDTASDALMSTLDANADKTVALTATYEQIAGSDPVIVVIGDIDGDGDADLDDAIAIKSKLIGGSQQIEGAPYAIGGMITDVIYCGDVDGDKDADLDDAIAIKSKLIGGSQQIEGAPYAIGESVQIKN